MAWRRSSACLLLVTRASFGLLLMCASRLRKGMDVFMIVFPQLRMLAARNVDV
ncbi:hypothetical protein BDZ45DRAFT_673183 [Acephala macrosclerotiorum]|nr:hypothetical protein BDZ45DRAFT_673183 [Acephala macrosclerotiorum]